MKWYFSLLFSVLFYFFSGISSSVSGQWLKNIIDDNIHIPVSVDVADLDSDSRPDLVVAAFLDNAVFWYQNQYPLWTKHTIDSVAAGVTFAYCGDVDGNGRMDVIANLNRARQVVWYENCPESWTKHIVDTVTDHADFLVVSDLNGDGHPDAATAGNAMEGGDVVWYENRYPHWIEHTIESGSNCYYSLYIKDVDGDNIKDIVATMSKENRVVWFKNEGRGLAWTKYIIDDSLIGAGGIGSLDLYGKGATDIVATTGGPYFPGSRVVCYENRNLSWNKVEVDTDLDGASWPYASDMDGNGSMDLIVTAYRQQSVVWYENNHPEWIRHFIDDRLYGPRFLVGMDMDGDRHTDVVVTADSSLVWYKNPLGK